MVYLWRIFPIHLTQIAFSSASELHVILFLLFVLEQTYLLWPMKGEVPLPILASVHSCPSVTWHVPRPRNWSSKEHGGLFWTPISETTYKIYYGKCPTLSCKNRLLFNVLIASIIYSFPLLKELDLGCPCRSAAHGEKAESSPFLPRAHTGVYSS